MGCRKTNLYFAVFFTERAIKNGIEEKQIPAPLKAKIPSIVVGFISNRIAVPTITAAERTNRNTANAILNFHCL